MSKRLLLLNLVLVATAVVFSIQVVRIILSSPQLPRGPVIRTPQAAREPKEDSGRARSPLASYDAVAAKNLFNLNRSETATVAAPPGAKPLLYGIVLNDGAFAAYLQDAVTKRVSGYKPGDAVAGGQLERVEADRVVIRRGEERVEVLLRDPAKPKPVAVAPPVTPGAQPTPAGSPRVQAPPTPPRPSLPPPFRRPQLPAVPPARNAPSP